MTVAALDPDKQVATSPASIVFLTLSEGLSCHRCLVQLHSIVPFSDMRGGIKAKLYAEICTWHFLVNVIP